MLGIRPTILFILSILFFEIGCATSQTQSNMLTYEQGLNMARIELNEISRNNPKYTLWEAKTITKEYGWVFFPATYEFIQTGNPQSLSPGISPILVNKLDSTCIMSPSSMTIEAFILDYESKLSKP